MFEDSFGKFVLPFKIVSNIYGKKNSIHHKEENSELIKKKNAGILPQEFKNVNTVILGNSENTMFSKTEKGFELKIKRQTYTPQLVYFTLLKMAYGIIPVQYSTLFIKCSLELGCILRDDAFLKDDTKMKPYVYSGFLEYVPGEPSFTTSCYIYKRKISAPAQYANFFFVVTFGNYSLQIVIPSDDERKEAKQAKAIPFYHFDNSVISVLDFNVIQKDYVCQFDAQIKPLSDLERISTLLQESNLI